MFVQRDHKNDCLRIELIHQWVRASRPDPVLRAVVLYEEGRAWRPSPIGLQLLVVVMSD